MRAGGGPFRDGVGDIEDELIIAPNMLAYPFERDKNLTFLPSPLKK
jgi:hypothetical protein